MIYRKIKAKKDLKIPKQKTLAQLKKDLTKVFNAYIRKRDSNDDGTFICISCNKTKDVRLMHAGHFHSAGKNEAVRWDELNVSGQCSYCNTFEHGNLLGYREGIIKKYGQKIVDDLEIKRHNKSKMARFEVQLLIEIYKQKLNVKN